MDLRTRRLGLGATVSGRRRALGGAAAFRRGVLMRAAICLSSGENENGLVTAGHRNTHYNVSIQNTCIYVICYYRYFAFNARGQVYSFLRIKILADHLVSSGNYPNHRWCSGSLAPTAAP